MRLLARYMDAQTYQGEVTWIIVDDVDPQTAKPDSRFDVEIIRPHWRWKHGQNTQAQCLLAGLERIPENAIVLVIEDDDCYLPEYIDNMLKALETADIAGEVGARYYNVMTRRWRQLINAQHSSLASTAVRGTKELAAVCHRNEKFIDIELWRNHPGTKALLNTHYCVGIKGMPGRGGIGVGHNDNFGSPDNGAVLNQWIGDYAGNYEWLQQQS